VTEGNCGELVFVVSAFIHSMVARAAPMGVHPGYSFAPLGLVLFPTLPTAYAVGCILAPLRG